MVLSQKFACPDGHMQLSELDPRDFSFNSPHGACPECKGLGNKLTVEPIWLCEFKLTLAEGAIRPWSKTTSRLSWYSRYFGRGQRVRLFRKYSGKRFAQKVFGHNFLRHRRSKS